jgi:putative restriction endonuclease
VNWAEQFQNLHVDRSSGYDKPHKALMLLAVIDAIEAAAVPENRISFDEPLKERFRRYFEVVKSGNDSLTPLLPFFHLRSDGFWHLVPRPGYEKALEVMDGPRGAAKFVEVVDHAELSPELFALLRSPAERRKLREVLIERWFPERAAAVRKCIELESRIGAYGRRIAALPDASDGAGKTGEDEAEEVRDTAFRRIVTEAYDYRCTACGLRLLHDGSSVVEACHLIPWSETHDDDPRNGIALCRNHHWAMDSDLIAPGPDMLWHASKSLDKRVEDEKELIDLAGFQVRLPAKQRWAPKPEGLEYRMRKLA